MYDIYYALFVINRRDVRNSVTHATSRQKKKKRSEQSFHFRFIPSSVKKVAGKRRKTLCETTK